ncbi:MAG: chemotaxis protein CheW [Cyanobacteria bacterium P01_D01_bin.44]
MDKNTAKIERFITFKVADHWFALPLGNVLKVVNCPPSDQGGLITLGMVKLGAHTIQLLDLSKIFGLRADVAAPSKASFLLVLRSTQKTLWGIALETPPDLLELPLTALQPVSADDRFVSRCPWISHMAVVSAQGGSRTLSRLDLTAVLEKLTPLRSA